MSPSQPDQPWLSVAMPIHHGERWLGQTLDSLAAQDCGGIEFLIFDSTDTAGCAGIVDRFRPRLNIVYQHLPHVASWQAKTNLAVKQASSAWVSMLHQDDLWLPNRVADIRRAKAAFPQATLLLNPSIIVDDQGRKLGVWRCPLPADHLMNCSEISEHLLVQNFVSIPAPVIKRSAWLECGGLDETLWYTADWDLYLKLIQRGRVVYRPTPSTAFRIHRNSLTMAGSSDLLDFERQMQTVLARHCHLIEESKLLPTRHRALASIAVNCALAKACSGDTLAMGRAALAVLRLGPLQSLAYMRDSRIMERALPRLRARFAGAF
jgi:glycosyltransferase involved in cell wall biosynthesis